MTIHVQDGLTYAERNQQLLEQWAQGEREIENDIIRNNTRLIRSIVRKYSRDSNDNEDLFQVGCLEMYRAISRYDAEKGSNFATFVHIIVIGAIRKYYRDKAAIIRLPRLEWELRTKIIKFMASYEEEYFKKPSIIEISEKFQIEVSLVSDILLTLKGTQSLDVTLKEEEDSFNYHNLKSSSLTQVEPISTEAKIMLEETIVLLGERERTLVHQYYFDGYTQTEIAEKNGISQISVSRTLKKAVLQMKQILSESA